MVGGRGSSILDTSTLETSGIGVLSDRGVLWDEEWWDFSVLLETFILVVIVRSCSTILKSISDDPREFNESLIGITTFES